MSYPLYDAYFLVAVLIVAIFFSVGFWLINYLVVGQIARAVRSLFEARKDENLHGSDYWGDGL